MAAYIQVLLPLLCVLLAQGHVVHLKLSQFPHNPLFTDGLDVHNLYSPLNPDLSVIPNSDPRPINGDVYSYNNHHSYDDYYHDGNYNPGMEPYYEYPPFEMQHLNNMPFGYPSIIHGNIHNQNHGPVNGDKHHEQKPVADKGSGDKKVKIEDKKPSNDKKEGAVSPNADKSSGDKSGKGEKLTKNKLNISLQPNKDYLLVGNGGNNVYLLHDNSPNGNPPMIAVPNGNQPGSNNIVYLNYNPEQPQQPNGQVYQVVNGQPPVYTNPQISPNRQNLNGYVASPVQNNMPVNNNSPSYVLIYANGQLIKIPGIVINAQQNGNPGPNYVMSNTEPPNVMYVAQPNQINNQMAIPPASNPGIVVQRPSYVVNPNIPSMGYPANNQPNAVPQPVQNNLPNYVVSNAGNPGPSANPPSVNPAVSVNNPEAQPAYALNPPTQEKETNTKAPETNTPANGQPGSSQPVMEPSQPNNNEAPNALGIQPAVMVAGFKDKKSEEKDPKKINKNKNEKDGEKKKVK